MTRSTTATTNAKSFAAAAGWSKIMIDSTLMGMDAWAVMGLRTMKIMTGGRAAEREAQRMVGEKFAAGFELAAALSGGTIRTPKAAAKKAVAIAGGKVRANRRRLG